MSTKLVNIRFDSAYDTRTGWRRGLQIGSWLLGAERSTVYNRGRTTKYLDRWIVYLGHGTLRLHKFWRGDDDRASHTHPWWFITFPLSTYTEVQYSKGRYLCASDVASFQFHFRGRDFEHVVVGRKKSHWDFSKELCDPRPFWTLVITGGPNDKWGFYPEPGKFVPYREFLA